MAVMDQRSAIRGQRSAGRWRRVAEVLVLLAASCLLLAASFQLGRDYERINALAAEPTAPVVTITRAAAAARIDPRCPGHKRSEVRGQRSVKALGNRG
jgi:hypothetical protein